MNHFILFILCSLSFELLIRTNYIKLIKSNIRASKKSTYIITNKKISDHWKERIIPKYALQIMKSSFQMLLTLFIIIIIFIFTDKFFSGFLAFTFSLNRIIESILFGFGYAYVRKLVIG